MSYVLLAILAVEEEHRHSPVHISVFIRGDISLRRGESGLMSHALGVVLLVDKDLSDYVPSSVSGISGAMSGVALLSGSMTSSVVGVSEAKDCVFDDAVRLCGFLSPGTCVGDC